MQCQDVTRIAYDLSHVQWCFDGFSLSTCNCQLPCADLHLKKRKREEANLTDEIRSTDDMSLDEGEIPTGHRNGRTGLAFWLCKLALQCCNVFIFALPLCLLCHYNFSCLLAPCSTHAALCGLCPCP